MEADAKAYDELSGPQIEEGSQFVHELNLSLGDKVLDMGCGTGHVTKYIANIVGPDGQVVGVDPDAERIKIAKEKYKGISNLQFYVGSSAIGFLYDNEPYYDVHISTNAFHWIPNDEKSIYLQKAHQCLKSGGKLAIFCAAKMPDDVRTAGYYPLTQQGCRDLFQEIGFFNDVVVDEPPYLFRFKSFAEFKQWYKASTHLDLDDEDPVFIKKFITLEDDGQVSLKGLNICITACKD
ncbi:Hypothetical predicted protein [Paramuricea clavata]|uniref:Methyltransferase domain-containing protein n=1 Tax=Paramuricea clavata TaxID=317549 RepID=A0A7D9EHU2_PARCT|nr:Hypothetical predicted protein [Paramuricea clavata]